ncbi:MAG: M16 family metallopeptidase [Planctomycetota bacterium]
MSVKNWKQQSLLGGASVWETSLSNGLTLLVSPMASSPVVAVQVWYAVGSGHEDPKATGVAHFLEHMMFKGTALHAEGEFDRIMERMGAHGGTNAFTSKDYTAYVVEVPASRLKDALRLEADRMRNLVLDADSLERERGVILDEKLRSLSDPESLRSDSLLAQVYKDTSMAWPILGTEEHLKAMSPRILSDFYTRHYQPGGAAVVVVGGVDPDEALRATDETFGSLRGSRGLEPLPPRQVQEGRHCFKADVALPRLDICFEAEGISAEEGLLMSKQLSGSEDALLDREFVLKGRAQDVSAWHFEAPKRRGAIFVISITLPEGEDPERMERDVIQLLEGYRDLPDNSLQSLKVAMQCQASAMIERPEDRASFLGQKWVYGEPFPMEIPFDPPTVVRLVSNLPSRRRFVHLTTPS